MGFPNVIERDVPQGKPVHVILDNCAAHKHSRVMAWLGRHPRLVFHFTPTSCSWLNAVEGFFAKLSKRRLKRGVFRSVADFQAAISRFLAETSDDPKPFVWTANPDKILAAVKRGHQVLDSFHYSRSPTAFSKRATFSGASTAGRISTGRTAEI
jgi:transposase